MGLIEFLIMVVVVVLIAWAAIWALGTFVPAHPLIIDKIIWGVAILIIVFYLIRALGLMGYDPQIPKVG